MSRIGLALVLTALTLGSLAGPASADSGSLPGGATIAFNRLFIHENHSATGVQPNANSSELWTYFNLAHCQCSAAAAAAGGTAADYESTFAYELLLQNSTTPIHAPLEIWVGQTCDDPIMRPMNCHQIPNAGISDIASIANTNGITPDVPVYDLMEPAPAEVGMDCAGRVLSAAEWAISDVNPDGTIGTTPQYFVSQAISTDALPPPLPTVFRASGGTGAIQIDWDAPTGDVADIAYYQALCADQSGNPGVSSPIAARYVTAYQLCGITQTQSGANVNSYTMSDVSSSGSTVDAGVATVPTGLANLDPMFVCGENADATATSLRIEGLNNGTHYTVMLLAIDKFGNAAATVFNQTLTPVPSVNFWEDVQNRGGTLEGGFCLIADTYGDDNPLTQAMRGFRDDNLGSSWIGRAATRAYYTLFAPLGAYVREHVVLRVIAAIVLAPFVAIALAWHWLTLPGLLALLVFAVLVRRLRKHARVRRLARAAAPAIAVVLALAPGRAHAQDPYWDDKMRDNQESSSLADDTAAVTWHVGLRVGRYLPNIDGGLGMNPGPYQQMFGGAKITPMLDVDRILWRRIGQLGAGISLGYMSKTANTWAIGSSPTDPNRPRAAGDTNSFHLIPLAVSAVYRFSYLDDEYGIPVVPYARAGLAYYIWWVTAPTSTGDSGVARVFNTDGSPDKAMGASLGVVGSVGLEIRAERIDATAARSMHDSGIEHAGFFVEYSDGKVDGLGIQKNRPSVGDAVFYGGVDFEF